MKEAILVHSTYLPDVLVLRKAKRGVGLRPRDRGVRRLLLRYGGRGRTPGRTQPLKLELLKLVQWYCRTRGAQRVSAIGNI